MRSLRSPFPIPSNSRVVAPLGAKLDRNLAVYIAAAGAAGVGVLALAHPAEAEIVYTPANTQVVLGNPVSIDFDHDGVTDIVINLRSGNPGSQWLIAQPAAGDAVLKGPGGAAAGFFGVPLGAGEKFASDTFLGYGVLMANAGSYKAFSWFSGPFAGATNRYLGLKFKIGGTVHYGWVRMTVGDFFLGEPVVITGYAYESVPNKTIIEGHVHSPSAFNEVRAEAFAPAANSATLGLLARGADGLALWRREREISVS